jgi:ribose transport system ATP-binding protein
MFLGAELTNGPFLDKAGQHRRAVEILDNLGFPLKANGRVAYLSRAEQQMVEIAKAFRTQPSILIFDEPTASLTSAKLNDFSHSSTAKKQGVASSTYAPYGRIRCIGNVSRCCVTGKIATLDAKTSDDRRSS